MIVDIPIGRLVSTEEQFSEMKSDWGGVGSLDRRTKMPLAPSNLHVKQFYASRVRMILEGERSVPAHYLPHEVGHMVDDHHHLELSPLTRITKFTGGRSRYLMYFHESDQNSIWPTGVVLEFEERFEFRGDDAFGHGKLTAHPADNMMLMWPIGMSIVDRHKPFSAEQREQFAVAWQLTTSDVSLPLKIQLDDDEPVVVPSKVPEKRPNASTPFPWIDLKGR